MLQLDPLTTLFTKVNDAEMMFKLLSESIMISKNEGQKPATCRVTMVYFSDFQNLSAWEQLSSLGDQISIFIKSQLLRTRGSAFQKIKDDNVTLQKLA